MKNIRLNKFLYTKFLSFSKFDTISTGQYFKAKDTEFLGENFWIRKELSLSYSSGTLDYASLV